MKKTIIIFMFLGLVGFIYAANNVAITLKAKGDINLTRGKELNKIEEGENLFNADELESKAESFAVVKFVDGSSLIKLFPNSILTINTDESDGKLNKRNSLKIGTLWAKVSKKTGLFEVDTPNTVVSVKGTEFILEVDEFGRASLTVKEGEVLIKNKDSEKEAMVLPGQRANEDEKGNVSIAPFDLDDFDSPDTAGRGDGEEEEYEILRFNLIGANGEREEVEMKFIKR